MQFIHNQQFKIINEKQKSTLMNSKHERKSDKVKIICCQFVPEIQILTCGLNNGTIIQFTNKKFSNKKLIQCKQYQIRKFIQYTNPHKGEIKCLLVEKIFSIYIVITGSVDRTIKLWDTDSKSKQTIQTLVGHQGTILCMIYSKKTDTIFSGSSDKTVRIWKQDQNRKYFMYPWYVCYQTISQFGIKKAELIVYPTYFDLNDGQINNFMLYMGDSVGNLHLIKQIQLSNSQYGRPRTAFEVDRTNFAYHRLAINSVVYIAKQHLVITSAYDQQIFGFQQLSHKHILKYANPRKGIFTSLVWYNGMIIASDEYGTLSCIQINSDKQIEQIKRYNCRINQLVKIKGRSDLLVVTDDFIDAICIIKGIKSVQGQSCHKGPIIGMFSLEAYKLTERKIKDQPKIVTVSLDNTMRIWDPSDLSCLEVLTNPQKSQICSLYYLRRANLFVTGHDNGMVRLWNIQLQISITISQQNSPYAHCNNVCTFSQYIQIRSNDDITQYMLSTGYEGKVNIWQIFIKKNVVKSSLMSSTICPQLKQSYFPNDKQIKSDQNGYQLFALQVWQIKNNNNNNNNNEKTVLILSAGTKGQVYFTKMFSYETYKKIHLHNDTINCMLIDQNILFTGSSDHTIKLTSLDNFQSLYSLIGHQFSINNLLLIQQTGHLISQAGGGQIFFWNYPQIKIDKKIIQIKQQIQSFCYVDQLKMIYIGTQQSKILSYSLIELYQNKVTQKLINNNSKISQQSLRNILKQNQQQLKKILNSN